jgi:hypothetical protein
MKLITWWSPTKAQFFRAFDCGYVVCWFYCYYQQYYKFNFWKVLLHKYRFCLLHICSVELKISALSPCPPSVALQKYISSHLKEGINLLSHKIAYSLFQWSLKMQKESHYTPGQALKATGGWDSQISRKLANESGKVISPMHRLPLPPRKYSL